MDRAEHISKLRSLAPFIFGLHQSTDMGVEFDAITQQGFITATPGMLISTEDEGAFPDWLSRESAVDEVESFLGQFICIPYDEISLDELGRLLQTVETAISSERGIAFCD